MILDNSVFYLPKGNDNMQKITGVTETSLS